MQEWFFIIAAILGLLFFGSDLKKLMGKLKRLVLKNKYFIKINYKSRIDKIYEKLNKRHISPIDIGHIWKYGDNIARLSLLYRLLHEYRDYETVVKLIDRNPEVLKYEEFKAIYMEAKKEIEKKKNDEKYRELVEGWRS